MHKKSLPQIFWAETYILNFTWTVATNKMRAKWELWNKKSCRCEEGGAHFKISVWHLLMNLKNNCLLKKLKWINKKRENFNIYNVVFFKKQIKKNTWRSWLYGLQFQKNRVWQTEIVNYGSFFALSPPVKSQKIKISKNWKIFAGDIIILHMWTENQNHMKYSSWDTEWGRHNVLSFWANFCPFTPLITTKNIKRPGDIILLHMYTINEDHMMHGSWDVRHDRQIFLSFLAILSLWPS